MLSRNTTLVLRSTRSFHTTKSLQTFYEQDKRRGAPPVWENNYELPDGLVEKIVLSAKTMKTELKKFRDELVDDFKFSPTVLFRHGEVDIVKQFTTDPKSLDRWSITCDKDYMNGSSSAKLALSSQGTGVFSGYLDTTVPKDGRTEKSGFANITLRPRLKSFYREDPYMWSQYNHLVLRVRGDGRTYIINLAGKNNIDMTFFDLHSYFLYTRGGPYWQVTKIPFSKFFFASKATVQDEQAPMDCHEISTIGITLADKISGPFRLEIDYIGCMYDESHTEEHAYETYKFARPM